MFRRYRTWLGEEIGLEPSVELFALDAAIISGVEAPRRDASRRPGARSVAAAGIDDGRVATTSCAGWVRWSVRRG